MTKRLGGGIEKDPSLPPPHINKAMQTSLRRHYDPDDSTTWGDHSIVLDAEDERILDKVWAEVARHPRMAFDPDAQGASGTHANGRWRGRGESVADDGERANDGHTRAVPGAARSGE